ncbi:MAG: glycosyltransferase [Desulfurococcales archaeon]|nr:glycosyltransferase [Desulfurococcales archaeon]
MGEYTRLLLTAMRGVDPSVDLLVLAEEGVGEGYFDDDAEARVVPSFRAREPDSFKGILAALQEYDGVDVLHVQHEYGIYGLGTGILDAALEARRERLAGSVVFTLHTVYHPLQGEREVEFQEAVLSEADAVIVHSAVQEFELHAQMGAYPSNLKRIPHGTSVNPYLSWSRLRLARSLGLGEGILGKFVVSLLGFLRPDKGLDTLLESLEILGRGDRLAVIVGGEVRDERLAELVEEHSAHGLVFIPHYLSTDEILMLAALSDAIVLPYRDPPGKYSVSGILHLSMGSLKPIIGSNVPRLAELYTLAPRLVFRAGDPWDLSSMLARLLDSEFYDLAVSYAGPLYSYAVRTSWPRMARRHLRLYRRLLKNRPGGR